MTAALNGTKSDRNTIISSRNAPRITPPMNGSRRDWIRSVRSTYTAVAPPTDTALAGIALLAMACGTVVVRSWRTRVEVAGSVGLVFGVTWMMAASPVLFGMAGVALATPGSAVRADDRS